MQPLALSFRRTLSYTSIPLFVSFICYATEVLIKFLHSDVDLNWQSIVQKDLLPQNSQLVDINSLFEKLRIRSMSVYDSYFVFIGIMVVLHIPQFIKTFFYQNLPITHQKQRSIQMEKNFVLKRSRTHILFLRYLIYFTISYYLHQAITTSTNLFTPCFVSAQSVLSSNSQESTTMLHLQDKWQDQALKELQDFEDEDEEEEEEEEEEEKEDIDISGYLETKRYVGDTFDLINRLARVESFVRHRDIVYQVAKEPASTGSDYIVFAMDISNPLAVKSYPYSRIQLRNCYPKLIMSKIDSTLFLVDCGVFHIFNVSKIETPPQLMSTVSFLNSEHACAQMALKMSPKLAAKIAAQCKRRPSVASHMINYRSEALIIINNGMYIYNRKDLANPPQLLFSDPKFEDAPIAILDYKKVALIGGRAGMTAFDLSDLKKPHAFSTIMKDTSVYSISTSDSEKTAFVGVIASSSSSSDNRGIEQTLEIHFVDLGDLKSMYQKGFVKTDRLLTCSSNSSFFADIKTNGNLGYRYLFWACEKDYGYFDLMSKTRDQFYSSNPIRAIDLDSKARVFLIADSSNLDIFAKYQMIEKKDPLIWKPNYAARLKLNPNISQIIFFTHEFSDFVSLINQTSLYIYQIYSFEFKFVSTMKLDAKPTSCVISKKGERLYMKTDPKTIQVVNLSIIEHPKMLNSINFPKGLNDDFLVYFDDQMIFATQTLDQKNIIFFIVQISDLSNPSIKETLIAVENKMKLNSPKLYLPEFSETLFLLTDKLITYKVTDLKDRQSLENKTYILTKNLTSLSFNSLGTYAYWIETLQGSINSTQLSFWYVGWKDFERTLSLPSEAGKLPLQESTNLDFYYVSTPEHLLEINRITLAFSRVMKLKTKQFSLLKDKYMVAVLEDSLELIHLRSKHALDSFTEKFPLGSSLTANLKLLELNSQDKYDPVSAKYKLVTANFFKLSSSSSQKEPSLSYSRIPNWINLEEDNPVISIEPRLPSHVGNYTIYITGSLEVPSELLSSLPFLNNPENLVDELIDGEYLSEDMFLTSKFNPSRKLSLSPQFSEFDSDIRCFLRDYIFGAEYAFQVTSSLFIRQGRDYFYIETPSPHFLNVQIQLSKPKEKNDGETEKPPHFLNRAYSVPKSTLNPSQTSLSLDGPLVSINQGLKEIVIDFPEEYYEFVYDPDLTGKYYYYDLNKLSDDGEVRIIVTDALNSPVSVDFKEISKHFQINQRPFINPNVSAIQTQVNKNKLLSGQSFSIGLDPRSFLDLHDISLEYTLQTKLEWLDLRGMTLTGTPPKQFLPYQVNVTVAVANEFKSEQIKFTLEIGFNFMMVFQYLIVYFGYAFSAYKAYKSLFLVYNTAAQRIYRYRKTFRVRVEQELTEEKITSIGFFKKEYKMASRLLDSLEKFIFKHYIHNVTVAKMAFIDFFKDSSQSYFDQEKLSKAICLTVKSLPVVKKHDIKYYMQVKEEQKEIIHRIIFDKIIFMGLGLYRNKATAELFLQIKDKWLDIVEQDDIFKVRFKVNKKKLAYVIQNLHQPARLSKNSDRDIYKNQSDDASVQALRSRYFSDAHESNVQRAEDQTSLLDGSIRARHYDVDFYLLELLIEAHAFRSHHINDNKETVTIISRERKSGSSCFYKLKSYLRLHLQKLQFNNKEDLGYGLKYGFKRNLLYFYGTPEDMMKYETLVVQILNQREMILREIYIFGEVNQNLEKEHIEQVQEVL